jgi:hypothetical protein
MGPNRRAQERERAAARAAEEAKRAEAEREAIAEAEKIVAIWNARQAGGRALWFYPTIGAAIAAGLPWLSFSCPACGQWGSVDLRTLDRPPGAAIPLRVVSPVLPERRSRNWKCWRRSGRDDAKTADNVERGARVDNWLVPTTEHWRVPSTQARSNRPDKWT